MSESIRRSIGAAAGAAVGTFVYWFLLARGYHVLAAVGGGVAGRPRSRPEEDR